MAGAFHGVSESDRVINVGVSGPGVVRSAITAAGDCDLTELAETIKRTAFKITRVGQLVAREASRRLGADFGIVDLSLAPTPAVGDSVARIIESMGVGTLRRIRHDSGSGAPQRRGQERRRDGIILRGRIVGARSFPCRKMRE